MPASHPHHRSCPFFAPGVFRRLVAVTALGAALAGPGRADELVVPSAATDERVFVSGVADSFDAVRAAVARAKQTSGRDYRVVIVDSADAAGGARGLLDQLVEKWREQTAGTEGGFDGSADVTIVLDERHHQLAMLVPWGVEVGSGLDPDTLQEQLIRKVFVPRAKDGLYDQGLAELVTATESWVQERADEKLAREQAARIFRTRTLPLGVAGLAGAGVLGGLLLQWSRHARRLRAARKKMAAFKGDVVALSDLLDAEQERHRMLPHTDPDFKTPMDGMTRAAYDNVQAAIRRYRERWLGLMDVWEKAQQRLDSEWFLGTAAAEDALRMLDSAEARPPLADVAGECRGPLDVLEQAHEKARELLAAAETDAATAATRLEALGRRGRSGGSFQAALAEVARMRERARDEVERDPVASRGRLEAAATTMANVTAGVDAIEAGDDRRQRASAQTDELEGRIRSRRAEGWLLNENGANPDDRVAHARESCDLAARLLDAGETEAAGERLADAEQANAEATALVESIVAARAKAEELLPGCLARLEAVAARRDRVIRACEQLAAGFAERSWSDVADNVAKADAGLGRARALVAEAATAADARRQEYFRAVALLEESIRQLDWIEGCHAAVTERLAELEALRSSLPPRRDAVREKIVTLERQLHRQQTDRVRANERCREAARILNAADGELAAVRPDLRQAAQFVEAADTAAARAEQFAAEDDRLARQAAGDIEETDSLVRRVAAWYAEGVQADVRGAAAVLETAKSLLERQRYEESIKAAGESAHAAQAAYAAATAEADRRRMRRQQEIRQRQLEDSFTRMSRGAGPWVIQLPGGMFSGPDPWRSLESRPAAPAPSRTAGDGWSRDIAQVGW